MWVELPYSGSMFWALDPDLKGFRPPSYKGGPLVWTSFLSQPKGIVLSLNVSSGTWGSSLRSQDWSLTSAAPSRGCSSLLPFLEGRDSAIPICLALIPLPHCPPPPTARRAISKPEYSAPGGVGQVFVNGPQEAPRQR